MSYARRRLENIQRVSARIRVENIHGVTPGYVRKTYTEFRMDTRSKYTASYAWIRDVNIQLVT